DAFGWHDLHAHSAGYPEINSGRHQLPCFVRAVGGDDVSGPHLGGGGGRRGELAQERQNHDRNQSNERGQCVNRSVYCVHRVSAPHRIQPPSTCIPTLPRSIDAERSTKPGDLLRIAASIRDSSNSGSTVGRIALLRSTPVGENKHANSLPSAVSRMRSHRAQNGLEIVEITPRRKCPFKR